MGEKKRILRNILTAFVGCLSLFFAGMVNMNSTLVKQEAMYKRIAELSKSNDDALVYATLCYGENGVKETNSAFLAASGSNFSGVSQFIPACFDASSGEMTRFSAGFSDETMRSVRIGDLNTYSNQKALHRFETAWINVYDRDTFNPHISHGNSNGFVFLPDFYADELIAGSNGVYASYDDLLPEKDSNGNVANFKYITVADGETKRKWSIVGIYHAKGFNEEYWDKSFSYNDGKFGKAINNFGAPFLIAYDSGFLSERINGLAIFSVCRQYSLEQRMKTITAFDKEKDASFTFYSFKDGTMEKMADYSSVTTAFLSESDVPAAYFVFMALAIAAAIAFFFLVRGLPYEKPWKFLCFTVAGPFVFSLAGSLCAAYLGARHAFLYSFFSYYFGIFTIVILGIAIGWFLCKMMDKRRADDEE